MACVVVVIVVVVVVISPVCETMYFPAQKIVLV